MAAQEYYTGTPAVHPNDAPFNRPQPFPYQQSSQSSYGGPPPPYSPQPQQNQQHLSPSQGTYPQPPAPSQQQLSQYNRPSPQPQKQQYLHPDSYPNNQLASYRTHSEPPEDEWRGNRHRHSHYHHDHSHGSHHHHHSCSSSRSQSRSRSRSRLRHRSGHHEPDHKTRDTFFGAGGGALIGDSIFPGAGTLGGMLLGGVAGREHAREHHKLRSKSQVAYKRGWTER